MIRLINKIQFKDTDNRMQHMSDIKIAIDRYKNKTKNLDFLLRKRFSWMNNFIEKNHNGIEVGSGVGFSKDY